MRSSKSRKKGNLPNSETMGQDEPKDDILFLSTMTLSAPSTGLEQLSQFLSDQRILWVYLAHLQSWANIEETEISSVITSLNGYTISSFVAGDDYFLAISRRRELGRLERLTNLAVTTAKFIFSKPVTWLFVLIFLEILAALMKPIGE